MDRILKNAPCGFIAFDDDGRIVEANATLLNLLGYDRDELLRLHVEKIFSVAGRIFYQTHFFPLLKIKGSVEEIYLDLRTRAGETIPVLVNGARQERDGQTFNDCVFVAMRQRSQYEDEILRAKREAEAATRAKDEFLSVVSHELRTPLNAIVGWVQMLRNANLDDHCRRGVEAIERSARIQSRLIEDLLDLSRIISGKLKIEVRQVELGEIISRAIEIITPAAAAKDIRLELILESDAFVSGDATRLQQVFWNLLSNAVKFTPKHGRVQIRLERVNSSVQVSVSDTGQGIKADFLPYVFERFRQANNSAATREGGLGLGMAITRNILELHGGTIKAESPGENMGATFTVRLPVTIIHRNETCAENQNSWTGKTDEISNNHLNLDGLTILVVDDDADGRFLMTTILSLYKARAITAASVAEALEKIESEKPDLVISDIEMPGENGFSLIKKLKDFNEKQKRKIPAVALTGHVGHAERLKVLKAGYQVHLPKPIEPEELLVVIANLAKWSNNE